ncbi:MAG: adenylosuccinate synthetase, partial [Aquabacterium sp.]
RLHAQRRSLRASLQADAAALHAASPVDAALLADEAVSHRWLARVADLVRQVPPLSAQAAAAVLRGPGRVVFEGAQGMLLDEWHGFHPHTTWSSVGPDGVRALLAEAAVADDVWHLGLLRSYLTRHGAGPLPTADASLNALPEPHNTDDTWQGRFRRGHPDAVLWRHALRATGRLDGLMVSHLDALDPGRPALHWCDAYALPAGGTVQRINDLPAGPARDLAHQEQLTRLLQQASPCLDPRPLAHADDLIERLEALAGCRVRWTAAGPTAGHVRPHGPAA